MEHGPLPQSSTGVNPYQGGVIYEGPPADPDRDWRTLALVFVITALVCLVSVAIYRSCFRDLLLTWRARRARTVTEFGFGNTPQRNGPGGQPGPVNLNQAVPGGGII